MWKTEELVAFVARFVPLGAAGRLWLLLGAVVCVPIALLIVVSADGRGPIARALSHPLPVRLGEISFSVYLIHRIFFSHYDAHRRAFANVPQPVAYALCLSLVLAASHFLWSAVEKPARTFLVGLGSGARAAPSWRRLASWDVAALALLLAVPAWLENQHFGPKLIAEAEAHQFEAAAQRESMGVTFGDAYRLRGARVEETPRGPVISLVWQSLQRQHPSFRVFIHAIGAGGRILQQGDYVIADAESWIEPGAVWKDQATLSAPLSAETVAIGVGLYQPQGPVLRADKGERDYENTRLWLAVPARAARN
jgi:hypothetical protein